MMMLLLQARRLNVQNDMQPVCHFFRSQGLSEQEVVEVCGSAKHVLLVSASTIAILLKLHLAGGL